MYGLNTPIWQLTVGEFLELTEKSFHPMLEKAKSAQPSNKQEKRLVYGIAGLAKLLSCSMTTAQKYKNSGVFDKAITQIGRKIIIDADLALKLAGKLS